MQYIIRIETNELCYNEEKSVYNCLHFDFAGHTRFTRLLAMYRDDDEMNVEYHLFYHHELICTGVGDPFDEKYKGGGVFVDIEVYYSDMYELVRPVKKGNMQ